MNGFKRCIKHFGAISIEKYECFVRTDPQSPFLAQTDPKFHFLKNNSLEMAVRYI